MHRIGHESASLQCCSFCRDRRSRSKSVERSGRDFGGHLRKRMHSGRDAPKLATSFADSAPSLEEIAPSTFSKSPEIRRIRRQIWLSDFGRGWSDAGPNLARSCPDLGECRPASPRFARAPFRRTVRRHSVRGCMPRNTHNVYRMFRHRAFSPASWLCALFGCMASLGDGLGENGSRISGKLLLGAICVSFRLPGGGMPRARFRDMGQNLHVLKVVNSGLCAKLGELRPRERGCVPKGGVRVAPKKHHEA